MTASNECACNAAPSLIFACSGAADVGLEKRKSPLSDDAIQKVAAKGKEALAGGYHA